MRKPNLIVMASAAALTATAVAGYHGLSSVQPVDAGKAVERQAVERITPIGVTLMLPEAGYYTVPFEFTPTQAQFNECLFPDAECNKSYSYDPTEQSFKANYTPSGVDADYWGFLPGIQLTPGVYKFSVEYKTKNYQENFCISIGTAQTPEAQTIELVKKEAYSNNTYVTTELTFDISDDGIYYIGMHHYSDPNMFNVFLRNFKLEKVDNTKPATPSITSYDFTDGEGSITISVPATAINGDPLPANVDVHLLIDDEEVEGSPFAAAPGESLQIPLTIAKGVHVFKVYVSADIDGEVKNSEAFTESHRITKNIIVPAPIPAHFACDEDEFSLCTVINANNDGSTWKYNATGVQGRSGFQCSYNTSMAGDDFVVFPALDITEAGVYNISFDAATKFDTECMQVYFVADASLESLRAATPVLDLQDFKHGDTWVTYECKAGAQEPGLYYLVFRYCSPKYKSYVYLSEVNVTMADPRQIGTPSFGEIVFDGSDGTVEVVLPATTLGGAPLGDVTVNATLKEAEAVLATVSGTPGETKTLDLNLPKGMHTITLTADYTVDGEVFTSDPVSTDIKVLRPSSFAYEIPLQLSMKGTEFSDDMVVFDVNNDKKTWAATSDGLKYSYHSSNAADDWVILLPVNVTDISTPLSVTVLGKSSPSYPEKFSIWMGTSQTIEGMTIEVMPETPVQTSTPTTYGGSVSLPAPGKYYIGFHATSDANKLTIYLSDLEVKYDIDTSSYPKPAGSLSATPDPAGGLSATVDFTMPLEMMDGTAYAEDTQLTARVSCGSNTQEVSGAPGEAMNVTIAAQEGVNSISVVIVSDAGESEPVETTVRCGLDTPTRPVITGAAVSESGCGVELSWEPVTTGVNGGVINPELIQYRITPWDDEDEDWAYWDAVYTTDTHCTYEGPANAEQAFVTIGIEAFQSSSTNSMVSEIDVVIGKPLECQVEENFEGGEFTAGPVYALSNPNVTAPSWSLSNGQYDNLGDDFDEDNYFLRGISYTNGAYSLVLFPMVSTKNVGSAELTFEYYDDNQKAHLEGVLGAYGEDRIILGEVGAEAVADDEGTGSGWKTYTFAIPETYMDRNWIQPGLFASFDGVNKTRLMLNSYSVKATSVVGTETVIAAEAVAAGAEGRIVVGGANGQRVSVYSLSGAMVYDNTSVNTGLEILVQEGIYLVKVGQKTFKVIVR